MICLIDYGAGNLFSVQKAVEYLGYTPVISNRPETLSNADKIIFPGVGSFGKAIETIHQLGLEQAIRQSIAAEKPFLGICLGLQLLFATSEESNAAKGLNVLFGGVKRFKNDLKIPHLGWNAVEQTQNCPLWRDIPPRVFCYFAHSYYIEPMQKKDIIAVSDYGAAFPVAVQQHNLFGVQFHPEKSQKWGLRILDNFLKL